ncbi:MAG: Ig-like domain-containing protein [Patescibacteria group bacterium]
MGRHILLKIFLSLVAFGLIGAAGFFLIPPRVVRISPAQNSKDVQADSEIRIDFSLPVNRGILIPSIEPDVPGEWHYQRPLFKNHFFRRLVFVPTEILQPETNYKIILKGIEGTVHIGETSDFESTFSTQTLPNVERVEPKDGTKNLLPSFNIKVKLSQPNPDLVDFDFILEPKTDIKTILNDKKDEYILTPKAGFLQGTEYTFKIQGTFYVRDKETKKTIFQGECRDFYQGSFETAPPPKIVSLSPTGSNVLTDKNVKIVFNEPMDKKSVEENFSITPSVKGSFSWSSDKKSLVFSPSSTLPFQTDFKVVVKKGTRDEKGKYLTKNISFFFSTIGRVGVSFSPSNQSQGVSIENSVRVYFDQPVDKESAQNHFRISPEVSGSFSFSGNTLVFNPAKNLSYQTTYKVTILSGLESIYGLDSNKSFSTVFTTQSQTFKLSVLLDFQDYPLSCEAAALKMALRYKGLSVSENGIMNYIKIESAPRQGNIWADPYKVYVGSLRGKQNTTGYGVYWDPIAAAAKVWRPQSQAFSGWSVSDLTKEIKNGNPIVVWGVIGSGAYQDSWYTKEGKYIKAWRGEHTRTVIGFVGNANSPSKIILNDPYVGQIYWSTSTFLSNWNTFGRSGVVVR